MIDAELSATMFSYKGSFSSIAKQGAQAYDPRALRELLDLTIPARLGQLAAALMRKQIRAGRVSSVPLGPLTQQAKAALGFAKPSTYLVATDRLVRSLTWELTGPGAVEVGFFGNYASGSSKAAVANLLEEAGAIRVTRRMRKLFIRWYIEHNRDPRLKGFLKYKEGDVIFRPARPWWRTAIRTIQPDLVTMLEDEIPKALAFYFEGFRYQTHGAANPNKAVARAVAKMRQLGIKRE
jgi:hypothetical protein